MNPQLLTPLIMVPIVVLSVWRRVRTQFGLQPIRRKAMLTRAAVFGAIALLVGASVWPDMRQLEGLLGGIVLGALLGLLGLRLTQFRADAVKGDCYLPNPWLGAALTVLLLVRLGWRLIVTMPPPQGSAPALPSPHAPLGQSPLTLLMLGLLIGYYVCYFLGLLVHHRRWQAAHPAANSPPRT